MNDERMRTGGKRNEGGRNLEMDQVCVGRRRRTKISTPLKDQVGELG